MQLAYVSTGSFISPGGRSLSEAFSQGRRDGADESKAGVGGGDAQLRQRCLKKSGYEDTISL